MHKPAEGSPEAELLAVLQNPKDWISSDVNEDGQRDVCSSMKMCEYERCCMVNRFIRHTYYIRLVLQISTLSRNKWTVTLTKMRISMKIFCLLTF